MFWFINGLLLIYIGVQGNLGAILASVFVPTALVDVSGGQ